MGMARQHRKLTSGSMGLGSTIPSYFSIELTREYYLAVRLKMLLLASCIRHNWCKFQLNGSLGKNVEWIVAVTLAYLRRILHQPLLGNRKAGGTRFITDFGK